jgi:PAS domain S-box-containing protein
VALRAWLVAALLAVAVLGLHQAIEPLMPGQPRFIVLLAAPMLAAWIGGLGPGLLAVVLCAVGGQALQAEPRFTWVPQDAREWARFGFFVGLGGLSAWLIATRRIALQHLRREHAQLLATQHALAARERRVRQTFEASPSGMLLIEPDGRIALANHEAARLFGYAADQLAGLSITQLLADQPQGPRADDRPAEPESARRLLGAGGERLARRSDGSLFEVAIGLNLLQGESEGLVLASVLDRTEQRRAEAALRHSQDLLQRLFETNLLGIMCWDLDGRVLDANDELLRIWGRERAALHGAEVRLPDLTPPEYALQDQHALPQLRASGQLAPTEKEYLRPDGSRIWVLVGSAMSGESLGVSFVLDISERKRAEMALRESEQRARELAGRAEAERAILDATLESAPAGIVLADTQGRPVRFNAAHARLWGAAPRTESMDDYREWKGWWADQSELQGEPIAAHDWAMARALRGETVREDIVEIEPFDQPGQRRTVVSSAAPVRDAQGRILGAVLAQTDVTALVAAQAALQENAAMFQSLADNIAQMAWMTDAGGFITWYNRRWFEYTGASMEQMKEAGWQWVHHPDHVARVIAKFRRHVASGEPWEDTFPLRGRDGDYRWFLSRAFPLRDQAGRIVSWFGTNTDVNAQRQAEEALRNADRRKDEFIAVLAHELRNPLAPVRNAVEILKRIGNEDARLVRTRDIIGRQVSHMARLIDDLLDVSRIARGKLTLRKEPCDLAAIVCQTCEDYRESLEAAGQRLVLHGCDGPAWVEGDPVRLAQMLGNLLTNAVRFQQGPGTVEVRTLVGRPAAAGAAREPGVPEAPPGTVRIVVSDTGIGMDKELLGRLFDPFAQATQDIARSKGGLGLGLALTKGLAELHGGGVMADSEGLGHGSRFIITLPLARAERTQRPPPPGTASRAGLRILVVEDNHDAAATLGELLQLGGHQVELAYDGRTGLALARQMRPDVVISDLGLPGELDGFDLARALRADAATESVYLIALSGYADASARRRCTDAGFDAHLAKPPDIAALEQALSAVRRATEHLPAVPERTAV